MMQRNCNSALRGSGGSSTSRHGTRSILGRSEISAASPRGRPISDGFMTVHVGPNGRCYLDPKLVKNESPGPGAGYDARHVAGKPQASGFNFGSSTEQRFITELDRRSLRNLDADSGRRSLRTLDPRDSTDSGRRSLRNLGDQPPPRAIQARSLSDVGRRRPSANTSATTPAKACWTFADGAKSRPRALDHGVLTHFARGTHLAAAVAARSKERADGVAERRRLRPETAPSASLRTETRRSTPLNWSGKDDAAGPGPQYLPAASVPARSAVGADFTKAKRFLGATSFLHTGASSPGPGLTLSHHDAPCRSSRPCSATFRHSVRSDHASIFTAVSSLRASPGPMYYPQIDGGGGVSFAKAGTPAAAPTQTATSLQRPETAESASRPETAESVSRRNSLTRSASRRNLA